MILCPTWIYEMHAIFKITHFSLYVQLTIHWIYPNLDFMSIMNLQDACKIFFVCPTYMRKLMSETRILNWNSGKLCQKLTVTTASWWGLWPMSETRRRLSHYRSTRHLHVHQVHGCIKFTGPLIFSHLRNVDPTFFPGFET